PWRRARHQRDQAAGRDARLREPVHGDRAARPPRRQTRGNRARRHRCVLLHNGGAEANENAIKLARLATGRHKILARYRSYHGATAGSMSLTGDPRRWAVEPGLPGVVHVLDPYHGIERGWETAAQALSALEEVIQLEGPHTIAAFILETVTGTNGVLVPPDGYLRGIRDLCTRHG